MHSPRAHHPLLLRTNGSVISIAIFSGAFGANGFSVVAVVKQSGGIDEFLIANQATQQVVQI